MTYDRALADRIRAVLPAGDWVEKPMFGGLAFLRRTGDKERLVVCAGNGGGLLLKVRVEDVEALLDPPEVDLMTMGSRRAKDWLSVAGSQVGDDAGLQLWLDRALAARG